MPMNENITAWFRGRIPDGWYCEPVTVRIDRDEILVTGTLPRPDLGDDLGPDGQAVALASRIGAHREDSREQRMAVAREAEHRFERKVSWGARCGDVETLFTTAGVPVMTRLRMPERQVLDTLIEAGIARSRSEALAWCVGLVGRHQEDWISQLREATAHVADVRAEGPDLAG
jgi:hypothetical protein